MTPPTVHWYVPVLALLLVGIAHSAWRAHQDGAFRVALGLADEHERFAYHVLGRVRLSSLLYVPGEFEIQAPIRGRSTWLVRWEPDDLFTAMSRAELVEQLQDWHRRQGGGAS